MTGVDAANYGLLCFVMFARVQAVIAIDGYEVAWLREKSAHGGRKTSVPPHTLVGLCSLSSSTWSMRHLI